MCKRTFMIAVVSAFIIAAALGMTGRTILAQTAQGTDNAVIEKLDKIMKTQKDILDQLALLRDELNIVKIRVSQAQ